MNSIFLRVILLLFVLMGFQTSFAQETTKKPVTVGILVPIQLQAMDEIVAGFKDQLAKQYSGKVIFLTKNAQGDANLQRAILQQFANQHIDLVAPIGTASTQAAISLIRNKPILGIAAEIDPKQLKQANNQDVTNVLDEVSVTQQIEFIHQALPNIHQMTLIYSPSDKIYPEVAEAEKAGKKYGISIQKLMIQQLADLYTVSQQINKNSQAIFVLKDELVVSGAPTLAKQAQSLHIPLIASDDGSVQKGAAFALGVSERQIGIDSANLAAQILDGKTAKSIPTFVMKRYNIFINPSQAAQQGLKVAQIEKTAQQFQYPVVNLKMENN